LSGAHVERRLAAVLAADVAGYSRLMGIDEVATLRALKAHRREVVDPAIAAHHGRIVKTTGDGMLVEFASAVDAVNCAVAVQTSMADRNDTNSGLANGDGTPRILFRIGINVGDIIIDGDDIFGDGVNVAARVEAECEPGDVYLSANAFEQIRSKTSFAFDDKGERHLKNIDRPVRVYSARAGEPKVAAPSIEKATNSGLQDKGKPLPLPDRPSIAVLPFQNMSGDPEQEYFADGMVEDIITALSRFKSLFVIARNSTFTYKGKALDIKQVGRELGVRYVLEGSVRKAGNRVRITGQLIEAATDRHVWADKFDGALEDIFDLQDQMTMSVVGLIAPKLEQAEIERAKHKPTDRLDSYDFYLRGTELVSTRTLAPLPEALELFKKAFERDPDYAAAYAMAAWTILLQQSISGVPLTAEMRAEAIRLADLGSRKGSDDAFALARSGHVLTYLGHEYDRGASMVEQAVALNPNLAVAWHSRGWVSLMCCEDERAIESFERMIRLSPLDPLRVRAWGGSSFALFALGRYEDGFVSAKKAIQFLTDAQSMGAYIVNAARAGHTLEAREAVAQLLKLHPDFRASHAQKAFPMRSQEAKDRITAALKDAGLPD
jgi:TolB-like protein/class 3 adenylate cyclase/Tfp pilus assembly protein PilF